jgi:hypothetical protein
MASDEERGERWDGWTLPDRQLYAAVGKMMRERDEARAEVRVGKEYWDSARAEVRELKALCREAAEEIKKQTIYDADLMDALEGKNREETPQSHPYKEGKPD